jgi:hypothetical protein
MLQFSYNQPTNSNAIYPSAATASANLSTVLLDFSQSYDLSTTSGVVATVLNTTGRSNPWLVFSVTGSSLPTASGQYDVDIWEYGAVQTLGTWITQATKWDATSVKWNGTGGGATRTVKLATERAYVSGSNESTITQYLSPNENGTYYTYNG